MACLRSRCGVAELGGTARGWFSGGRRPVLGAGERECGLVCRVEEVEVREAVG